MKKSDQFQKERVSLNLTAMFWTNTNESTRHKFGYGVSLIKHFVNQENLQEGGNCVPISVDHGASR